MAARFVACRNTVTGGEQALPARAVALGIFPNWAPISDEDAAIVAALKPAPAPETPEPAPEPAIEPDAPAPTRKRKAADAGHDNNEE